MQITLPFEYDFERELESRLWTDVQHRINLKHAKRLFQWFFEKGVFM